ncbi:MAG: IS200/IS605 family transposase [Kiritimatiellaeota bacterium]|nr:IS200/IS605 family transposase [Kiritimatiellota bacterium]
MPQSLSKILLHLVFSTKNRERWIDPAVRSDLHAYLAGACRAIHSEAYRVGGTDDHVHIACTLPRTLTVSKLLEEIKKSSSAWMKTQGAQYAGFAWQAGYGAFSLGQSQLPILLQYIDKQEEHHRTRTFKEELLEFLERYAIEYDERYLWDWHV